MGALETTIADEIRTREERVESLVEEIASLEGQLGPLRQMAEMAQTLSGNGGSSAPEPVEQTKPKTKAKGDRSVRGRKGGKAPVGRSPSSGRQAGSAPSRSSSTASTSNGDGGTKRAAVLAFVKEHGQARAAELLEVTELSLPGLRKLIQRLVKDGALEARGETRSRIYVLPGSKPTEPRTPPSQEEDDVDQAYLERMLIAELKKGPRTASEAADVIDAPFAAVAEACRRLSAKGGKISQLADGTYVA